jgi:hypothetical protein
MQQHTQTTCAAFFVGVRAPVWDAQRYYFTHPVAGVWALLRMLPFTLFVAVASLAVAYVAQLFGRPFGVVMTSSLEWIALPVVGVTQFIVPRWTVGGSWAAPLAFSAPTYHKRLTRTPVVRTLKRLAVVWLVKICALTLGVVLFIPLAVAAGIALAPFVAVAVPAVVAALAVLILAGVVVGAVCSTKCCALCRLALHLTWALFYVALVGGTVGAIRAALFTDGPALSAWSLASTIAASMLGAVKIFYLSGALASALCAQFAMRLTAPQWDALHSRRSAELFGLGLPCWALFYAHPLLGLMLLEWMTTSASLMVGRLVEEGKEDSLFRSAVGAE